eukprot:3742302-Rhodomonas_salina.1
MMPATPRTEVPLSTTSSSSRSLRGGAVQGGSLLRAATVVRARGSTIKLDQLEGGQGLRVPVRPGTALRSRLRLDLLRSESADIMIAFRGDAAVQSKHWQPRPAPTRSASASHLFLRRSWS